MALILASLGACIDPHTALLLPVVVKGGWDLGRLIQVLPHFISDEWSTRILIGFYPGTTQTAFASVMAFFNSWRLQLHRQTQTEIGFLRAYALTAIPHHVFEATPFDLLNRLPHSDAAFVATMARLPVEIPASILLTTVAKALGRLPLPRLSRRHTALQRHPWSGVSLGAMLQHWLPLAAAPLLGFLHPILGLVIAANAAVTAGVYEQFPTHRAAHRPFAQMSLLELALQSLGLITKRAEHQLHHRPEHACHFSGSTGWVDRLFDHSGLKDLLNLLAYSLTQTSDGRIVPMSWARDPSRLETLVGERLPLEEAYRIAQAKSQLVGLHRGLRRAMRSSEKAAVLAAPDPAGSEATAVEAYIALRLQVDGVRLEPSDVAAVLCGDPLEDRFVRELVPQTPASAWPQLSRAQIRCAVLQCWRQRKAAPLPLAPDHTPAADADASAVAEDSLDNFLTTVQAEMIPKPRVSGEVPGDGVGDVGDPQHF
ncbi:MAG: fatty acid desaturase CarF family protein [Synechococcaceae cyanobacterium]|nr:fatty acid desaturase CarF family protein [Synechococcaceae cyanobacterium]